MYNTVTQSNLFPLHTHFQKTSASSYHVFVWLILLKYNTPYTVGVSVTLTKSLLREVFFQNSEQKRREYWTTLRIALLFWQSTDGVLRKSTLFLVDSSDAVPRQTHKVCATSGNLHSSGIYKYLSFWLDASVMMCEATAILVT